MADIEERMNKTIDSLKDSFNTIRTGRANAAIFDKVRVDYYDDNQQYLESRIAYEGDIVFLGYGGHGFKMLEDSEIVEVKQGPYCGAMDKVRFEPVDDNKVILK